MKINTMKILIFAFVILVFSGFSQTSKIEYSFFSGVETTGDYSQRYGQNVLNKNEFRNGITSGINITNYLFKNNFILQSGIEFSNRDLIIKQLNSEQLFTSTVIRFPFQIGKFRDFSRNGKSSIRLSTKIGIDYNTHYSKSGTFPLNDFIGVSTEVNLSNVSSEFPFLPSFGIKAGSGMLGWNNSSIYFVRDQEQFIYLALYIKIGISNFSKK